MASLARTSLGLFAFLTTISSICVLALGYLYSMPLLSNQAFERTLCTYIANANNGVNTCQCKWDFLDDNLLLCFSEYPCITIEVEYYVAAEDRIVASLMQRTAGTTYGESDKKNCFMKPEPCKEQIKENILLVNRSVARYTNGEKFPCFHFTNKPLEIYAEIPARSSTLLGIFLPFLIPAMIEGISMILMVMSAVYVVCRHCRLSKAYETFYII